MVVESGVVAVAEDVVVDVGGGVVGEGAGGSVDVEDTSGGVRVGLIPFCASITITKSMLAGKLNSLYHGLLYTPSIQRLKTSQNVIPRL